MFRLCLPVAVGMLTGALREVLPDHHTVISPVVILS